MLQMKSGTIRERHLLPVRCSLQNVQGTCKALTCDGFFQHSPDILEKNKKFWVPFEHAVLSEQEGKFIISKMYYSLLWSHQIFQSQSSLALSALSHVNSFMYTFIHGVPPQTCIALCHGGMKTALALGLAGSLKDSVMEICGGQQHAASHRSTASRLQFGAWVEGAHL